MPNKAKVMTIGRPGGYKIHGQGRGAKYPEATIPPVEGFEVGQMVQYQYVAAAGLASLQEGDLILRVVKG